MKNFKLYYREHGCWLEFDEETFLKIRRERQRVYFHRKKAQECYCSKRQLWLCDGLCDTCEFYQPRTQSLETPINNEKGFTLLGCLSDGCNYEDLIVEKNDRKEIILRIKAQMPILLEYGEMKLEGYSDRKIAEKLQIKRTTLYRKIEKMRKILGESLEF